MNIGYVHVCQRKDSIKIFPICHFKNGTIFFIALYLILIFFSLTWQKSTVIAERFQRHKILRQ